MPNLLLTMWDTIKSSNIGILVAAGLGMFAIIGGFSMLSYHYTLSGIKSRTVGDGQHGTARWATDKEIRQTYAHVPFKVRDWRKGVSLPAEQGLVLGCKGKKDELTALVDSDDIHCLMIAASGAGKTAFFLYPNLEYACASGMSFLALDTKGDLARNYGSTMACGEAKFSDCGGVPSTWNTRRSPSVTRSSKQRWMESSSRWERMS